MFTGIVQTPAKIVQSTPTETGKRLTVERGKLQGTVNHGDSICTSGVSDVLVAFFCPLSGFR